MDFLALIKENCIGFSCTAFLIVYMRIEFASLIREIRFRNERQDQRLDRFFEMRSDLERELDKKIDKKKGKDD